jgi:hypothetical protein
MGRAEGRVFWFVLAQLVAFGVDLVLGTRQGNREPDGAGSFAPPRCRPVACRGRGFGREKGRHFAPQGNINGQLRPACSAAGGTNRHRATRCDTVTPGLRTRGLWVRILPRAPQNPHASKENAARSRPPCGAVPRRGRGCRLEGAVPRVPGASRCRALRPPPVENSAITPGRRRRPPAARVRCPGHARQFGAAAEGVRSRADDHKPAAMVRCAGPGRAVPVLGSLRHGHERAAWGRRMDL